MRHGKRCAEADDGGSQAKESIRAREIVFFYDAEESEVMWRPLGHNYMCNVNQDLLCGCVGPALLIDIEPVRRDG